MALKSGLGQSGEVTGLADKLWNGHQPPGEFSTLPAENRKAILDIYKLYVRTASETSERRMRANGFFLTLHTTAIAGLGAGTTYFAPHQPFWTAVVVAALSPMGVYMCLVWWRLLTHFQKLNAAKYVVVGELEKSLPVAPTVAAE